MISIVDTTLNTTGLYYGSFCLVSCRVYTVCICVHLFSLKYLPSTRRTARIFVDRTKLYRPKWCNETDETVEMRPDQTSISAGERERAKEIHCSVLYAHREFYTKAVYCCTTTFLFPLTFSLLKNRVGVVGILVFISHFIFSHTTQFGLPNSSISVEP